MKKRLFLATTILLLGGSTNIALSAGQIEVDPEAQAIVDKLLSENPSGVLQFYNKVQNRHSICTEANYQGCSLYTDIMTLLEPHLENQGTQ